MTLLAFGAGGRRYGIDVRAVAAVVPVPPLRPLDLAPEWVAGVFVFLGHLVPVVDLCRKLGISERTLYACKKRYAGMGRWTDLGE